MSIITEIKYYQKEYEKFMKIEYMPEFKIQTYKSQNCNLNVTFYEDVPIINIPYNYIKLLKSNSKPAIFHECTHILDNHNLLQNMNPEEKEILLKWYTEYHATEVQMKAALRFEYFNSSYMFSKSSLVHDWFKNKTVEEDVLFKTNDYKTTIRSLIKSKDIYGIILHTIYYISQLNFWRQYCKDDVGDIADEKFVNKLIGKDSLRNLNCLFQSPTLNDVRYFNTIKMLTDRIAKEISIKISFTK